MMTVLITLCWENSTFLEITLSLLFQLPSTLFTCLPVVPVTTLSSFGTRTPVFWWETSLAIAFVRTVASDSTYLLASGSGDKSIKIWNLNTDDLVRNLIGHEGGVWPGAFDSADLLASGSEDKTVKLWYKNSGQLLNSLIGHEVKVFSVAFADNDVLASGSDDKTITLWDKNTVGLLRSLSCHGNRVWQGAFDSNSLLTSASREKAVNLWGNWFK